MLKILVQQKDLKQQIYHTSTQFSYKETFMVMFIEVQEHVTSNTLPQPWLDQLTNLVPWPLFHSMITK